LRFRFKSKKIEALYTEEKGAHKYPPAVVDAFFEVIDVIRAAVDEQDLYALKGLRYEKLKGKKPPTLHPPGQAVSPDHREGARRTGPIPVDH